MEATKLPFDDGLQNSIICLMMQDESFLSQCNEHLKAEYFSDKYKSWLFDVIIKYHLSYKKPPTASVMRTEIMKFDESDRPAYDRVFNTIMATKIADDEEYLLAQLTAFAKRSYFLESIQKIENVYNSGPNNRISAVDMVHTISEKLYNIKFGDEDLYDYNGLDALLHEVSNSNVYRTPLGIPYIDEALLGGIDKRDAVAFLGPTNSGKSMLLMNIARNMMERGKRVLFINLENAISQFMVRFLSSMSKIPYNRFYRADFNEAENLAIQRAKTVLKEKLLLKNWYDYGICAEDLYAYCSRLKLNEHFDAIIIDYAGVLKTRNSAKMSKYDYMQEVGNIITSLARKLEVPVITALQGNRDAQKRSNSSKGYGDLLRCTDIADSFGFIRPMGVVITITKSDSDRDNNIIKLLIDKQREGVTGVAVEVETDLQRCLMLDDSLRCSRILTTANQGSDDDRTKN